jgi:Tfp pilus assembly protein PilW
MRGTSIIELIVYGAILAFLSVFAINTFLVISSALAEARLRRQVNANAELIMERLMREIRFGKSTDVASVFGAHPSRLVFTTFASPTDDTEVAADFYVTGTGIFFQKGGFSALKLNTDDVGVTNFVLRQITASVSTAVKIELEIEASTTKKIVREKFYGTAVMRGSY